MGKEGAGNCTSSELYNCSIAHDFKHQTLDSQFPEEADPAELCL